METGTIRQFLMDRRVLPECSVSEIKSLPIVMSQSRIYSLFDGRILLEGSRESEDINGNFTTSVLCCLLYGVGSALCLTVLGYY